MTDNEIIEALGCCSVVPVGWCDKAKCPMIVECLIDRKALEKHALDLINRQQAELDDLKRDDLPRCKDALRRANEIGMAVDKENQELKAEIAKLQGIIRRLKQYDEERDIRLHARLTEKARAEAIKEFAERLKEELYHTEFGTPVVDVAEIGNLVKEMVGASDG